MKKIKYGFLCMIICGGIVFPLAVGDVFARAKGFGSSRSFSKSKSFSKSNWGAGKKAGLSKTKSKSSAGKMSSSDRNLYNRAKASGTVFNSKSDALKSFKGKYGSKYPTKFKSQPDTRPSYIPPNISIKGKKHKVFYRKGGYGYYMGASWLWYSLFDDDDEVEELMAENGYYYGPKPGLSFMAILGMGITLFLLITILKSLGKAKGRQKPGFNISK